MRLIRCYVENFGKLHQFKLEFDPEMTVLHEKNGFGKTTLAVFIKSMFYGLSRSQKSLEKSERKRYYPWQGGIFGGYLEFEHNRITYRIERTFGTTPKQDQFRLFRLSPFSVSDDYTENIGYEIFGISESAFEKTCYMPQLYIANDFTTPELRSTLANMVESVSDIGDYAIAVQTLKKQRSKIESQRGKSGILSDIASEISHVEVQLTNAKDSRNALTKIQSDLLSSEKNLTQSQMMLNNIENSGSVNSSIENIRVFESTKREIIGRYPNGLPNSKEAEIISEYVYLNNVHGSSISSTKESREYSDLKDFFRNKAPNEIDTEGYKSTLDSLTYENNTFEIRERNIQSISKLRISPSVLNMVFFSLITVALGYVYQFIYSDQYVLYSACATALISALSLLRFVCIIFKKFKLLRLRKMQSKSIKIIEDYESILDSFLEDYHLSEWSYIDAYNVICKKQERYLELHSKNSNSPSWYENERKHQLASIKRIFEKYSLPKNLFSYSGFIRILDDIQFLSRVNAQILELKTQSTYSIISSADYNDIETLKEKISGLKRQIITYHRQIAVYEKEADQIVELEHHLRSLVNKRNEMITKLRSIDKAIEHLEKAYQTLSCRYTVPVKKQFTKYLREFLNYPSQAVMIDSEMRVTIEISGIQRDIAYLSTGEQYLMAFCMRLALIDVLYENKSPILILDDPFVYLDESNMAQAMNLLERLSQTHQVLYITCQENRI